MKIEAVQKKKDKVIYRINGVTPAYMNALRRVFMTETPVMAIENVEISKNSGPLFDEIIAHRLGMLSLKTDLKSYNLKSECKCKGAGCAQCQATLILNAKGPKTVYAEDIVAKDPHVKPVHGKTVIAKLIENQEIELIATAELGIGREHAKWDTGLVYYKEYPQITISKQPSNAKELAKKYPQILAFKANKLEIKEKEIPHFDLFDALAQEAPEIKVAYKDDYLFYIESWGQLSPNDIVSTGIDVFNKQLDEVKALT